MNYNTEIDGEFMSDDYCMHEWFVSDHDSIVCENSSIICIKTHQRDQCMPLL